MLESPSLDTLGSSLLEMTGLLGKAHLLLEEQEEQLGEGVEDKVSQQNRSFAAASGRVKTVPKKM